VDPRGTGCGARAVCETAPRRDTTAKSLSVTSAPNEKASCRIADSTGRVSRHDWEPSHVSNDRPSGTDNPNSAAAPSVVTAMMSWSRTIAVGRVAPRTPAAPTTGGRRPRRQGGNETPDRTARRAHGSRTAPRDARPPAAPPGRDGTDHQTPRTAEQPHSTPNAGTSHPGTPHASTPHAGTPARRTSARRTPERRRGSPGRGLRLPLVACVQRWRRASRASRRSSNLTAWSLRPPMNTPISSWARSPSPPGWDISSTFRCRSTGCRTSSWWILRL